MRIVSLIRDSFQEYKGKQSLVLFSRGCNFNCDGCYNYKHVTGPEEVGEAKILIDQLITPMHDAIVFLGGEPTIWGSKLIEAAKVAKQKQLKVKVYSNGFLPNVVERLNQEKLVDAWSIDFKCVKDTKNVIGISCDSAKYINCVSSSIRNITQHGLDLEIRTTLFPTIVDQVQAIQDFVKKHFPEVEHIWQEDFNKNLEKLSA